MIWSLARKWSAIGGFLLSAPAIFSIVTALWVAGSPCPAEALSVKVPENATIQPNDFDWVLLKAIPFDIPKTDPWGEGERVKDPDDGFRYRWKGAPLKPGASLTFPGLKGLPGRHPVGIFSNVIVSQCWTVDGECVDIPVIYYEDGKRLPNEFTIAPVPLPPAIAMLGTAVIALVVYGSVRRPSSGNVGA
jgi:hypothetical protein